MRCIALQVYPANLDTILITIIKRYMQFGSTIKFYIPPETTET